MEELKNSKQAKKEKLKLISWKEYYQKYDSILPKTKSQVKKRRPGRPQMNNVNDQDSSSIMVT